MPRRVSYSSPLYSTMPSSRSVKSSYVKPESSSPSAGVIQS